MMCIPLLRRNEDGQAMPLAILAVGIVFMIMAGLTQTVAGTVKDSRKGIAGQEARGMAEAGVEELFSRLIADPDYLRDGSFAISHPVLSTGGWWHFDADGRLAPCPPGDRRSPCYQLAVEFNPAVPGAAVIKSVGSSYCNTATRVICAGKVGMRSTVRRRSFLEFLIHADSESVEVAALPAPNRASYPAGCDRAANDPTRPVGCFDAAYHGVAGTGADGVDGPIHSNDSRILICGQPRFTSTVEVFTGVAVGTVSPGQPGYPWQAAPAQGCSRAGAAAPQGGTFINGPSLSLPFTPRPGDPDIFTRARTIALSGANGSTYVFNGTRRVELLGTTVRIDGGATQPLPDTGVIYVDGNVEVSGRIDGRLSIVAAQTNPSNGNITVTDDTTYACASTGVAAVPADCDDALGLNAQGSVVVQWRPRDLTIHAAMASVQRSVYVDRWVTSDFRRACTFPEFAAQVPCNSGAPLSRAPVLHVGGAIVGHYRGVYGAYNTSGTGTDPAGGLLISGFAKDFVYDARFRETVQPPYFVEPVSTAWAHVDEVEVPPGLTGVTGAPAPTLVPTTVGPSTTTTVPPVTTTVPGPSTTTTVPPVTTTVTTTTLPPTTTTAPTTTLPPTTTTTTCILPGILC